MNEIFFESLEGGHFTTNTLGPKHYQASQPLFGKSDRKIGCSSSKYRKI